MRNMQMSAPYKDKFSVRFHEVSAYFSEDEWALLDEWQKKLYENVMKEIHRALNSLGYEIINPGHLLQIKKWKETFIWNPQGAERRAYASDTAPSFCSSVSPDILLRIKQEDQLQSREWHIPDKLEMSDVLDTGQTLLIASCMVKEEAEMYTMDCPDSGAKESFTQATADPAVTSVFSQSIKEDVEHFEDLEPNERFAGDETLNITMKTRTSIDYSEKNTVCKAASKNNNETVQPRTNRMNSKCHLWSQRNQQLEDEKTFQWGSDGGDPKHSSLQRVNLKMHRSNAPDECERNLWMTKPLTCQPSFSERADLLNTQRTQDSCKSFIEEVAPAPPKITHLMEKPPGCLESQTSFSRHVSLMRHQWMHAAKKPNSCTDCGKIFSRKSNLNKHIRMHNGETSHKCADCEKSFICKSQLYSHRKSHSGRRSYSCPECDKSFSHKGHLNEHKRKHTGERPYPCTQCEKRFSHKSNLNKHILTHTGEKPFQCTECQQSFRQNVNLKKHLRIHTEDRNNPSWIAAKEAEVLA